MQHKDDNEAVAAAPHEGQADWKLARSLVEPLYLDQKLYTGEARLAHADGMAEILRGVREDNELIIAAYFFSVTDCIHDADEWIEKTFGKTVLRLVRDLEQLMRVSQRTRSGNSESSAGYQSEALRRMLLAMCHDLRVVVLRLASRLQTLRWFAKSGAEGAKEYGRETLALYSPLANRLGIWQIKWELEDLSLRLTEPETYAEIICDGKHVNPAAIKALLQAKGWQHTVLITDCLGCGGMPEGSYTSGGMDVIMKDNLCWLADGKSIAGSVLTLAQGVKNIVDWGIASADIAIRMATEVPARSAHIEDKCGSIMPGRDADFVVFDHELTLVETYVGGQSVGNAFTE